MKRGEIRMTDFEPARGSEANKRRPAVIVSNNGANRGALIRGRGVVTVVPLTSNIATVHSFQVLLTASDCGIDRDSKVQIEQIRAVDVNWVGRLVGAVPVMLMGQIDEALRLQLDL